MQTNQGVNLQNAVIYTRVSTLHQAEEGTSLAEQLERCLGKAKSEGMTVIATYSDEGVSGALFQSRPGIQSALADIESHRANCLITMRLDRAGRDTEVILEIERRVTRAGGTLLFVDGMQFEQNATGRLMLTQMAGIAQYEKSIIRERTVAGAARRLQSGKTMAAGSRPFGYIVATKLHVAKGEYPPEAEGKYFLHPDEAPIAARIFEQVASGMSLRDVANCLLAEGVRTVKGGKWWTATISDIIKNPVYKGMPQYGRTTRTQDDSRTKQGKQPHYQKKEPRTEIYTLSAPPLVSGEVWDLCQNKLRSRDNAGNPAHRTYLLSGLLRCPECGASMSGNTDRRSKVHHRYYRCHKSYGAVGEKECSHTKRYQAEGLEEAAVEKFLDVLQEHCGDKAETARQVAIRRAQQGSIDEEAELQRIMQKLRQLEAKELTTVRYKIKAAFIGQNILHYEKVLTEIYSERKVLQEKQERLEQSKPFTPKALWLPEQGLKHIACLLTDINLDAPERKKILNLLFTNIKPDNEKCIIYETIFQSDEKPQQPQICLGQDTEYQVGLAFYTKLIALMNE